MTMGNFGVINVSEDVESSVLRAGILYFTKSGGTISEGLAGKLLYLNLPFGG